MDRKWWVLLSIGIGGFMAALDASVVNTILPIIQREFHCEVASVQWAITVYLLAISVLLLSFGRLGDLWGHRRIYISGFWLFVIGSALCGMSPSVVWLVAFRSIQAIGAAMVFASSPALLTFHFPSNQRGQALGLQATMTYLGLALGPALGGWLTEAYTWRSVFYINVPVGVVALAAGMIFIPVSARQNTAERFDYIGAIVFMAGLVALLLGLNQGHEWGWASWQVLSLTAVSASLLAAFVAIEMRVACPMLDLSLFRQRMFSTSVIAALLNYICMATVNFLMPFYLIQERGLSVRHAGLLLTIQPLAMAIAAPISGTISDRIRSSLPSSIGMLILAVGTLVMSGVGPNASLSYVAVAFCLTGLGTGIFISPNNSALMGSAPANRQGIAAGMMATARNVGIVLGVGLAGAILSTLLARGHAYTDVVKWGLHVATVASVLGGLASLARPKRKGQV